MFFRSGIRRMGEKKKPLFVGAGVLRSFYFCVIFGPLGRPPPTDCRAGPRARHHGRLGQDRTAGRQRRRRGVQVGTRVVRERRLLDRFRPGPRLPGSTSSATRRSAPIPAAARAPGPEPEPGPITPAPEPEPEPAAIPAPAPGLGSPSRRARRARLGARRP